MPPTSERPQADEYGDYFRAYIGLVPAGDIMHILSDQMDELCDLLSPLRAEQTLARPKPDDWNIVEVLGHITDAERVFMYRALHIARGDTAPLAPFDQDAYVAAAGFAEQSLAVLLDAYAAQRHATIAFLRSLNDAGWMRRGIVSGNTSSTRAWAYIAAGHERYHINDFHERYAI